jgi:hypothetical protein
VVVVDGMRRDAKSNRLRRIGSKQLVGQVVLPMFNDVIVIKLRSCSKHSEEYWVKMVFYAESVCHT